MAADVETHAPSGRYIRVYLLVWGLLAAGGLGYLATLALQPETSATAARTQAQAPEPDQSLLLANRALSEVGKVRQSVGEMQRDLGQMRDNLEQRDSGEKAVQSRLAALEDRVTTLATPVVAPPPPAAPTTKKEKGKSKNLVEVPGAKTTAQRASPRVISVVGVPPAPGGQEPPPPAAAEPPVPLETGSVTPPAAPITFGEPVVTPTRSATTYAVQVGAGPSLDALRLSWSMLMEKHGEALGTLEPRFVAPRTEGAPYRLVAGPLQSKADAERICAQMGLGRASCFSVTYIGEPL